MEVIKLLVGLALGCVLGRKSIEKIMKDNK